MPIKPTPTQEENDLAMLGMHVMLKEHDGSAYEDPNQPPPPEPEQGAPKRATPTPPAQPAPPKPAPTGL
jgi:hypothetical protein